jgi:perosamine synthetase
MLNAHPTLRFQDIARIRSKRTGLTFEGGQLYYTYNARGALYQLFRSLPEEKGKIVLLPAFHCPTIVESVLRSGHQPIFYGIQRDLSINKGDLRKKLSKDTAAVLIINYCGFPAEIDFLFKLKKQYEFYVIEDCAHSFLDATNGELAGKRADVAVFSFYKLIPSYAGGGLRINTASLNYQPGGSAVGVARSTVALKRLLDQVIENRNGGPVKAMYRYLDAKRVAWRKKWIQESQAIPVGIASPYAFHHDLACARMPWFARIILGSNDFSAIVCARRNNFIASAATVVENSYVQKVFRYLPDNVCPWAYPVLITERAKYDHLLRRLGVPVFTFGESLHPLLYETYDCAFDDAVYLSNHLLLIPVHQNHDRETTLSCCQKINTFFAGLEYEVMRSTLCP